MPNGLVTYAALRTFLDGMLCMMLLYALLHYTQHRRAIYWQYALYIACMVLDFRLADRGYQDSGYLPGTYFPETVIESLAYVLYIRFAVLLMDLTHADPVCYRVLRGVMLAFGVALLVDGLLLTFHTSLELRSAVYMVSRVLICGVGIWVVPRIFRLHDPVINYFIAGSVCLLICSILALGLNYVPTAWMADSLSAIALPVSILQIGVAAEVLCFVLGMSLRNRQTERERLAVQAQLIEQLQENERKQQKLQRIRNDIARDLHDDLGADLSGLSVLSSVAAGQLHSHPDEARATLKLIGETARRVVTSMREIIWSLNASHLSVESTLFRLRETAFTLFQHQPTELHVDLPTDIREDDIPPEHRRELFLMYKEILHNTVRHAQARQVHVEMAVRDQMLCLIVHDDGVGFDVQANGKTGNGLVSLHQRADALGGQLNIESAPGQGTTVFFCGPVIQPSATAGQPTLASSHLPA